MADGVSVTPGSGAVIASDDAGAAGQVQIVKLAIAADGSATIIPSDATDGLLVNLGANNDVTVSGVSTAALQGALTETAPATDTASSATNGRLQRVAQRITSMIALLPASLGQKTLANGLAVSIASDQTAVPISGTITASGTLDVDGQAAHDAAISGDPVRIGARAMSADVTAVGSGDAVDIVASLLGKAVNLPYALPGLSWVYAGAAGGLVNTTGVSAKAAAGAGIRIYVTSAQVINSHATISTEIMIRDGAAGTVLHRGWAQAAGGGYAAKFDPPLRGTANTLVEIAEVTATATTGVLVDLQGYVAAE